MLPIAQLICVQRKPYSTEFPKWYRDPFSFEQYPEPARGQSFGRKRGYRPSDRQAPEVIRLIEEGYSQRRAAEKLGISKTTVNEIVKRYRAETTEPVES